jgi:hypothetical protein
VERTRKLEKRPRVVLVKNNLHISAEFYKISILEPKFACAGKGIITIILKYSETQCYIWN